MRSTLTTLGRSALAAILSLQIIVGSRPWFAGGGFEAQVAEAAPESESSPTPMPSGTSPADRVRGDAAAGFDYGVDTNSGAFATSIPIDTPPGRLGIEPKLALSYNSSSGTPGTAGVGWDLVLPAVRLTPTQPLLGAPQYQLDGRRLIADATGGFATEQDSYARIRRACSLDTCFIADDHNGVRMRFGGSSDSRQYGWWGLDRVEDAHGNYLTVSYMTDTDFSQQFGSTAYVRDGALVPKEIRYTGSATRAPWYAVRFDYEARPASDTYFFQSGYATTERLRYRLRAIRVVGGDGVAIRTYTLSYTLSPTGRSLLTQVALLGLAGAAGPQPFTMTYNAAATGFTPPVASTPAPLDSRVVVGDFNGDGRSDLVTYRRTDPSGLTLRRWRMQLGTATGLSSASSIWLTGHDYDFPGSAGCVNGNDKLFAGDWDADGDTDLFHYSAGCGAPRWQVLVAQSDHFEVRDWIPAAQTGFGSPFDVGTGTIVFGDFDGDGRADALVYRAQSGSPSTLVYSRAASPGYVSTIAVAGIGLLVAVGDFNGDRMLDVVMATSAGPLQAYCATASGGTFPCGTISLPAITGVMPGDFNGDGLTDLIVTHASGRTLETSTRLGFSPVLITGSAGGRPADIDGDGRDDLVSAFDAGNGNWVVRHIPESRRDVRHRCRRRVSRCRDGLGADLLAILAERRSGARRLHRRWTRRSTAPRARQ